MKRRTLYEVLAMLTLAIATVGGIFAAAGAALQQGISFAAATLCSVLFLIPGLYFLGYARRLESRDLALAHAAAFATSRGTLVMKDLARELSISDEEATKILKTAVREGHLRGRFDDRGRFVADEDQPASGGRSG